VGKRQRVVLVALFAIVACEFASWALLRQRHPVEIIGALSAQEAAAIGKVVRREIWRGVFPDFSSKTFKELPGNFKSCFSRRLVSIRAVKEGDQFFFTNETTAMVEVESSKEPSHEWSYILNKSPAGWVVAWTGEGQRAGNIMIMHQTMIIEDRSQTTPRP
jgi:hypothetical protein